MQNSPLDSSHSPWAIHSPLYAGYYRPGLPQFLESPHSEYSKDRQVSHGEKARPYHYTESAQGHSDHVASERHPLLTTAKLHMLSLDLPAAGQAYFPKRLLSSHMRMYHVCNPPSRLETTRIHGILHKRNYTSSSPYDILFKILFYTIHHSIWNHSSVVSTAQIFCRVGHILTWSAKRSTPCPLPPQWGHFQL